MLNQDLTLAMKKSCASCELHKPVHTGEARYTLPCRMGAGIMAPLMQHSDAFQQGATTVIRTGTEVSTHMHINPRCGASALQTGCVVHLAVCLGS